LTNILQTKVWRKVGWVLVLTSLNGYSVFTHVTGRGAMKTNTERKARLWYFNPETLMSKLWAFKLFLEFGLLTANENPFGQVS